MVWISACIYPCPTVRVSMSDREWWWWGGQWWQHHKVFYASCLYHISPERKYLNFLYHYLAIIVECNISWIWHQFSQQQFNQYRTRLICATHLKAFSILNGNITMTINFVFGIFLKKKKKKKEVRKNMLDFFLCINYLHGKG